jgi:hypothetical protein
MCFLIHAQFIDNTASKNKLQVCTFAKDQSIDEVFIGPRGLGAIGRLTLGSFTTYMLSHCKSDVTVVHQEPSLQSPQTILVLVDGSETSHKAFHKGIVLYISSNYQILIFALKTDLSGAVISFHLIFTFALPMTQPCNTSRIKTSSSSATRRKLSTATLYLMIFHFLIRKFSTVSLLFLLFVIKLTVVLIS